MWLASILARIRWVRRLSRATGLSWPTLLEVALLARGRWRALSRRDRARLAVLLARSRGWPGNLSALERAEIWALLVRMDLRTLAADVAGLWRGGRRERDAAWRRRVMTAVRVSRAGLGARGGSQGRGPGAWRARRA